MGQLLKKICIHCMHSIRADQEIWNQQKDVTLDTKNGVIITSWSGTSGNFHTIVILALFYFFYFTLTVNSLTWNDLRLMDCAQNTWVLFELAHDVTLDTNPTLIIGISVTSQAISRNRSEIYTRQPQLPVYMGSWLFGNISTDMRT